LVFVIEGRARTKKKRKSVEETKKEKKSELSLFAGARLIFFTVSQKNQRGSLSLPFSVPAVIHSLSFSSSPRIYLSLSNI
jgi:hypothetical protein